MNHRRMQIPQELFHGTTVVNACSIVKDGLQPLDDLTYACEELEMAKHYALSAVIMMNEGMIEDQRPEGDYAVVIINAKKSRMRYDGADWIANSVPREAIKRFIIYDAGGTLRSGSPVELSCPSSSNPRTALGGQPKPATLSAETITPAEANRLSLHGECLQQIEAGPCDRARAFGRASAED
jgi:hypothetical protein